MNSRFYLNGKRSDNSQLGEDNYQEGIDPNDSFEVPSYAHAQQQGDGYLLTQKDLEFLASRIIQSVGQVISQNAQYSGNKKGNDKFEKDVIWYLENLFKGGTAKDEESGQLYYTIPKLLRSQDLSTRRADSIIKEIQSLRQIVESLNKTIEEQANIIKKQHERIIQYENDVIYKTQKDLIMELIGIADQLRYTINDYKEVKDFDSLYNSIGDLTEWVDGSLQAVAVRKYVSSRQEYDSKRQEIVENQDTENPNEDGKTKSLLPGYIWAVPLVGSNDMQGNGDYPKTYEFMIRPEQVARLRYVAPKSAVEENTEEPLTEQCIKDDGEMKKTIEETTEGQPESPQDSSDNSDTKKTKSFWDRWID